MKHVRESEMQFSKGKYGYDYELRDFVYVEVCDCRIEISAPAGHLFWTGIGLILCVVCTLVIWFLP